MKKIAKQVAKNLGPYAFMVGVILAAIAAVMAIFMPSFNQSNAQAISLVLVVIGLVVGYLNVTEKEVQLFLVAGIALLMTFNALTSAAETILAFGAAIGLVTAVSTFLSFLSVMIAPAVAVVAFKAVYELSKDK